MYTFKSRVRYSELNHQTETLDPYSIINYFQDCSTFHSEDLNRGISYLNSKNRIWLLTAWQLELQKPVGLGEDIIIGTWAYDFKGFYGYRNFIMKNEAEETIAIANSIWAYMDTQTGRPVKLSEDYPVTSGYGLEPPYPMNYADRKILLPQEYTLYPTFVVSKSNIDSYNHVNNGQYIKMAQEYLPEDFHVRSMRVEYRNQAVLKDKILPMVTMDQNSCTVVLADEAKKPYSIIEFSTLQKGM